MFKKIASIVLAVTMMLSILAVCTACGTDTAVSGSDTVETNDFKVGVILIGDENEGYSYAHIEGIKNAAKTLGISEDQIIWKYTIPEDQVCYDSAIDLADQGCQLVIANSYGHQSYMEQAASEIDDVTFISMTGDTAGVSGLANFKNAFTGVYESRYVAGVVAGMKLAELVEADALTEANYDADGNIKIGYVGAFPYAEVVSGYTAFFLGIRSVVENVTMEVQYTNSWADLTAEGETANALVSDGCVIIGQHADTTGAPAAVQALNDNGTVAYSVGYNVDMLSVAPTAALTSAASSWDAYYTYALGTAMNGEEIATDWAKGYSDGAVFITELGESCAEGTEEKVAEVIEAIKNGELHVFDCSTWTVGGETLESYDKTYGFEGNELIWDGYFHESELRSAPCFDIRIDGITELNN